MKWFKHITDSLDDPFIFDLIEKFGGDGYMTFFGHIEMVARECRDYRNFVKFSWRFSARKLLLRQSYVKRIVLYISESGRFEVSDKGEFYLIRIPKLVELRDNYTKDKDCKVLASCPQETFPPLQKQSKNTEEDKEEGREIGGVDDKLVITWKSLNPDTARAYPKHFDRVKEAISTARRRGMSGEEIEKRLYETAGKGVKPWDLFPAVPPKEEDPVERGIRKAMEKQKNG